MRDQLTKMEFLYDLDPNKPLIKYDKGQADIKFDPKNLDKFPGGAFSRDINKNLIATSDRDLV